MKEKKIYTKVIIEELVDVPNHIFKHIFDLGVIAVSDQIIKMIEQEKKKRRKN